MTISDSPTAIERAFELAKSGKWSNVNDLFKQLKDEGYDASEFRGPTLRRQLRELIRSAKQ